MDVISHKVSGQGADLILVDQNWRDMTSPVKPRLAKYCCNASLGTLGDTVRSIGWSLGQ